MIFPQASAPIQSSPMATPAHTFRGTFADPVFVLCNGRSGSTLLRFLLDAHPDLACPPETNLPGLCVQLATVWSLIEGAPLSVNRGDEPPDIPEAAIAGVRETMDRMVGSYLGRRGKKRYCDKSLGTARYAELLSRVYPDALFVCLYRHPMDVVASAVEACPWGLNGYGFEPYIAATPGNMVMALASFWADNTQDTLTVEERFADRCIRVRYEDMVANPEGTASQLFDFLGVPQAPGVSERCFSPERERFGPGDHKIWHTSRISTDSVGRGWSVPTGMIAPQLTAAINDLADKLGYLPLDTEWGTTAPPADLRTGQEPATGDDHSRPDPGDLRSAQLGEQLHAGLLAVRDPGTVDRWGAHGRERFVAVVVTGDQACPGEYWLVDLDAETVQPAGQDAQNGSDWDVIGSLEIWEKVMDRRVNLSAALRSCQLRYCDNDDTSPLASNTRIDILADLLGLARW